MEPWASSYSTVHLSFFSVKRGHSDLAHEVVGTKEAMGKKALSRPQNGVVWGVSSKQRMETLCCLH